MILAEPRISLRGRHQFVLEPGLVGVDCVARDRDGDDRPPRKSYGDRGGDDRPPRKSYGDRGGDDRPPRKSYGDRDGDVVTAHVANPGSMLGVAPTGPRIGILGHVGNSNLGDEAIIAAHLEFYRRHCERSEAIHEARTSADWIASSLRSSQ